MATNSNPYLVTAALGLAGATMALGAVTGAGGVMLAPFAAAAFFYAAVTRNVRGALVAGAVAVAILLLIQGPSAAIGIGLLFAVPAFVAGWYANLSRAADEDDPNSLVEWFPISELVLRLTAYAGLLAAFGFAMAGPDWASGFGEMIDGQVARIGEASPDLQPDQLARLTDLVKAFLPFLPAVAGLFATATLILGLMVAIAIARSRKSLIRETVDWPADLALPPVAAIILGVATALFVFGVMTTTALAVASAFATAFVLVGVATVHYLLRGKPVKLPMLILLYLAMLFFAPVLLGLAALGLAETLAGVRARASTTPPNI